MTSTSLLSALPPSLPSMSMSGSPSLLLSSLLSGPTFFDRI
jgi:hypothetical protein